MLRGYTLNEMSKELFVANKTIRFHLTNIYKKTGKKRYKLMSGFSEHLINFINSMQIQNRKNNIINLIPLPQRRIDHGL